MKLGVALFALVACNPAHDIADKAYADEMSACVETSKTIAESHACREKVRERWGIVVVERKDAGHD